MRFLLALVVILAVAQAIEPARASGSLTYVRTIGTPPSGQADMYPSGIDAHPAGTFIAVADTGNERIITFKPDGQWFAPPFGSHGSSPGRFNMPRDVAVDGLGNIYVADMQNNRIQEFSSAGAFLTSWKGSGASALSVPMGLDIDDSSVVWVADTGHDRVSAFARDGTPLGIVFGGAGKGPGQLKGPRDVSANAYAVYVADTLNNRVQMFSRSGTFIRQWGRKGSGDSQFVWPYGVATDARGLVYVLDATNARVQIFDKDGNFLAKVGQKGEDASGGQLWQPRRVAVDPAGNIYVASMWNFSIQKYGPYASPERPIPWLQAWGGTPPAPAGVNQVRDLALGPEGNIYTIDRVNQRVQAFSQTGVYLFGFGERGGGADEFGWPEGIAADVDGNIYVADTNHDQIKKFAPDGTQVAVFGTGRGNAPGQLKGPEDVLVDPEGNVFVADTGNGRVQKFSPAGEPFLIIGGPFGPGDLKRPSAMFLTSNGQLYVADRKLSVVYVYSGATGEYVRTVGFGTGSASGQLRGPRGVVVTASGEIIIADTENDRLAFFRPTGAWDFNFGTAGSGDRQFFGPNGVLVVGNTLYVADTYNSRVQVFNLP